MSAAAFSYSLSRHWTDLLYKRIEKEPESRIKAVCCPQSDHNFKMVRIFLQNSNLDLLFVHCRENEKNDKKAQLSDPSLYFTFTLFLI